MRQQRTTQTQTTQTHRRGTARPMLDAQHRSQMHAKHFGRRVRVVNGGSQIVNAAMTNLNARCERSDAVRNTHQPPGVHKH